MPNTASEPAGEPRASFTAWWMLAVLLLFYIVSFLDRSIVAMLVQPIKADLGLTDFQVSLILGPAFAVFYAVAGFPLGWAADRFPRRWVIFGGVVFWALATTATGLARSFSALFAARVAVGIGEASLTPAAYTLLADRFPRDRLTTAIAIYQGGARIGPAAAYTLGGIAVAFATVWAAAPLPIIGKVEPWHLVMMMVGIPGVLLAFLVFSFAEPPRRGRAAADVSSPTLLFGFLKKNAYLMTLILVGFSLIGICGNALAAWVPTFMERRFGWEAIQYGPVLGVISLISAGALVVKGGAIDWLFGRGMKDAHLRFYTWLLAATVPIAWFAFYIPNPVVFLSVLGVFEVVALAFMLYVSATLTLIAPNQLRGQLSGLFLSIVVVAGNGAGPMIVGAITTFVLKDDNAVGTSLAITVGGSATIALVLIRLALKAVKRAVLEVERLDQAPS